MKEIKEKKLELNKRLYSKDAELFAKELMKLLSLREIYTPDEMHFGKINVYRIGRFQLITGENECEISYLTKEDFKNKNFDAYKSVRKDILNFSTTNIGYVYGTDSKGKRFIKDVYNYCDDYSKFFMLLASYEILTEKDNLSKKEISLKKRIGNIINLDENEKVSYKKLEKLFYESIDMIEYDDFKKKINMGKEAVDYFKKEEEKENCKIQEEEKEAQELAEKKRKRRPLIIATAPVSLPAIGLKKLSNKIMMFLSTETKKARRKRKEEERKNKEEEILQEVEEFKNF